MERSLKMMPVLTAGVLCAAFAVTACAPEGPALPPRESAQEHALYEQCLKTLPPEQAAELKELRPQVYPVEMRKYDDLLRSCIKMQNENFVP